MSYAQQKSDVGSDVLLEAIPWAVSLVARDGLIVSCNTAWARMLGRKANDIVGARLRDFVSPQTADKELEQLRLNLAAGARTSSDVTFAVSGERKVYSASLLGIAKDRHEDRRYFLVQFKESDKRDPLLAGFIRLKRHLARQARQMRIVLENRDALEAKIAERTAELTKEIAERKKAEEVVEQKNEFLRNVLESLTYPFCVINADDYTVELANSAVGLGKLSDTSTCYALTHQRDTPCSGEHVCPLDAIKRTRQPVTVEHLHYDKDGRAVNVEVHGYPVFDNNGNVVRIIEYSLDITARKQTEDALQWSNKQAEQRRQEIEQINKQLKLSVEQAKVLAEEAVAANKAKSQFLANMSHEIRTPMNGIIGFSELLAQEKLTAEQQDYVKIIGESGQNLLTLIGDILDFSKIEAGKLDTQITDCSLKKLLASIDSLLRPRAKEKGLEFEVLSGGGLPTTIRTDPARVHQCLINLVNNAIKFTDSGHIHVKVFLEYHEHTPFIRFDVEDTGIGIRPDKREIIFESFSQVDGSSTREYGGAGLGLAITKRLTEILGGKILLDSQPGKGSVFSLIIPAGIEVQTQNATNGNGFSEQDCDTTDINTLRVSGKVLVAEDNPSNRQLVEQLLGRAGLQVTSVEDGRQLVDKATSESFDLMLIDIQMPHMNGCDAVGILREQNINTPMVALTACAMHGDAERCLAAGFDQYISKPICFEKLYDVVAKYLGPVSRQTSLAVPC